GRGLTPERARVRIEGLVVEEPDAAAIVERIVAVMGRGAESVPAPEVLWASSRLVESLARHRPVVLSFDDVQWGEETFLDLLDHVSARTHGAPVLLVCTGRPELAERRASWVQHRSRADVLQLEPLSGDEAIELVELALGPGQSAEAVAGRLASAAGG